MKRIILVSVFCLTVQLNFVSNSHAWGWFDDAVDSVSDTANDIGDAVSGAANNDEDDIHTILMDGGGNDILIPVFTEFDPYDCQTKGSLSDACEELINDCFRARFICFLTFNQKS